MTYEDGVLLDQLRRVEADMALLSGGSLIQASLNVPPSLTNGTNGVILRFPLGDRVGDDDAVST